MKLTSPAFQNEGTIPYRHSKDGGNVSPALAWTDIPGDARSLVLIVDDPDAPNGVFVHWLVYGMAPQDGELPEGVQSDSILPAGGHQGVNGFGEAGYGGPKPPSGTHRYVFHLYALDLESNLPRGLNRAELDIAIKSHVIGETRLMGRYHYRESTRTA